MTVLSNLRSIPDIVTKPGVYDLGGETVLGGRISDIPDVTIKNGAVLGEFTARSCDGLYLNELGFEGGDEKLQGLVNILGGDSARITNIRMNGGRCAGQFHVGRDERKTGTARCPRYWYAAKLHCSGNGLWGIQPQAHCTYFNTVPGVDMQAVVEDCIFEQPSGEGYVYKVGGTGNFPWQEGSNGILTRRCKIVSAPGLDGRALPIVVQGMGSRNIVFEDIEATMVHSEYSLAANLILEPKVMDLISLTDGATASMRRITFPKGAEQYVETPKSFLFFRWFASDKRTAGTNVGGLRWAA
jgi:hypothetical protein